MGFMEFEQFQDAVIAHAPDGEVLEWNAAAERLYGWSGSQAVGESIFDLIPTGFPEPYENLLDRVERGETWQGLCLQRNKEGADVATRIRLHREDGLLIQHCRPAGPDLSIDIDTFAGDLLKAFPGSSFIYDLKEQRTLLTQGQPFAGLGYTPQEIADLGSNLLPTLLHPDDLASTPQRMADYEALGKGDIYKSSFRVKGKNGGWKRIDTHTVVFAWDVDGNPSHIVGFASDVTDQHESQQAAILAKEQLRFALATSGMIAWIWDFKTGEVIRVGDVQSIYGRIEPTCEAFFKAVHPDDWHLVDPSSNTSFMNGHTECVQLRVIRTDGQVRWVEERGTTQSDADGNPTHMVGVTIDITEQRRRDEINRRTHRSLRLALQAARASTWQWDCLTNLIVVSDDAFELFGLPRGAPPTMDAWMERIHPEDRNRFWIEAKRTAAEGMDLCIDFRVQMPDDSIKPVRAVAQRATDENGNATEVIGIVMDLSITRGPMRREGPTDWAA